MEHIYKNPALRNSPYVGDDEYEALDGQGRLRGFIYQLKLLMLFMIRGLRTNLTFRLATEMMAAGYFDDLVLECKCDADTESKTVYRFLQAKHSQNDSRETNAHDLFTDKDFNLNKYLNSYCQIKQHAILSQGELKDFTICTNVDLDAKKLESQGIKLILDERSDKFLDLETANNENRRYKFDGKGPSMIYEKLASEAYNLAQTLVEHILNSKKLTTDKIVLKKYRTAVKREIINVKEKKISDAFIEGKNLSDGAKKLRDQFYSQVLEQMGLPENDMHPEDVWMEMKDKSIEFSQSFVSDFEPEDLEKLAAEFENLLEHVDDNKVVKIDMSPGKICEKHGQKACAPNIVRNIDTLLERVLVEISTDKIQFQPQFLDVNVKPRQDTRDILKLKKALKSKLSNKFDDLGQYQFEIENLNTVKEEQLRLKNRFPDSNVNDKEIRSFLEKLTVAVKQPNEYELGEILKKEISEHCKLDLLHADLVITSFEKEMRHWFLNRKGSFLTMNSGREYLDAITGKIGTLVMSGLSLAYPEQLRNYDMHFREENQELLDYLTRRDKNKINAACNLVATEETLTAAIQVYRAVENSPRFGGKYDNIIIPLNDLLLPSVRKHVIDAFGMQGRYDLLVVVSGRCNDEEPQELSRLYEDLQEMMMDDRYEMKKLIFVTSMELRFKNCDQIHCKLGFNDLTDESQKKLLNKQLVILQGREENMSFAELLRIRPAENIDSKDFKNFGSAIDSRTLVKLIHGKENIRIGFPSESLDRIEDYFINRTLHRRVIISADILKSKQTFDIYAVGHADKYFSLDLELSRQRNSLQRIKSLKWQPPRFVKLNYGKEEEQFKKLCDAHPKYNVHWFMATLGQLLWIRSKGSIATLIEHRDLGNFFSCYCQCYVCRTATSNKVVDELAAQNVGPVIISDIAGTGKTTILTHFARIIQETNPRMLVMHINLNDCTDALEKEKRKRNVKTGDQEIVTKFLVNDLLKLDTELERVVLKKLITERGGVALLFDGFDEISPDYKETVIAVLRALKEGNAVKLVVSTRPHMQWPLKRTLGTFAYAMRPFSQEDQIHFLVGFSRKLCGNVDETLLRIRAETVLKKFANSVFDRLNKFAGIPLHTRMIAQVFFCDKDDMVSVINHGNMEPDVSDHIKVADLYRIFVDKKYEIYRKEKKKEVLSNLGGQEDAEELKTKWLKGYRRLAMYTLLKEENSGRWNLSLKEIAKVKKLSDKISEGTERTGIVTNIINQRANFIHRTFMEYLIASYLFENLENLKENDSTERFRMFILNEILVKSKYNVIRAFLNDLLSKPPVNSTHGAPFWTVNLDDFVRDLNHRNIFHIAAEEGNYKIMKFFFTRIAKNFRDPQNLINIKSKRHGRTLMHIVTSKKQLEKCQSSSGEDDLAVLEWLLDQRANVNATDENGNTPMHTAVKSGHLMALKLLAGQRDAVKTARNHRGETLQHVAAQCGNLNVLKWLIDYLGCNVNARDDSGKTLQLMAAENGHVDVLKWLVDERGCNVEAQNNWGTRIHHIAGETMNSEMILWLVEKEDRDLSARDDLGTMLHGRCPLYQKNKIRSHHLPYIMD